VCIDPLPQLFACGGSLHTALALDAHDIGRKPVAITAQTRLGVTTERVKAVLVFGKGRCEPPQPSRTYRRFPKRRSFFVA